MLQPRFGSTINLPNDIAPLVATAYGRDKIGPPAWQDELDLQHTRWLADIDRRTSKARTFQINDPGAAGDAILGWIYGNVGEADDDAQGQGQVRDGERSLEILLVQKTDTGQWQTPAWLPAGQARTPLPVDQEPSPEAASALLQCALRLPISLSQEDTEAHLQSQTPPAWQNSKLSYRMPVAIVDSRGLGTIGDWRIRYTPHAGLEVGEKAKT